MRLKTLVKQKLPSVYQLVRSIYMHINLVGSNESRFTKIYQNNVWSDSESISGPGSTILATGLIQNQLPVMLKNCNAKSMLDIPCGDFNWMSKITLPVEKYIGADIVKQIILENSKKFSSDIIEFAHLDLIKDELPTVDVILIRDCFVHFSDEDILKALQNISTSGSKYIITTNHFASKVNKNILTGDWRPLSLMIQPFHFPKPLDILYEDKYNDKSLCLWEISKIPAITKVIH